jgi:hypothetical protein
MRCYSWQLEPKLADGSGDWIVSALWLQPGGDEAFNSRNICQQPPDKRASRVRSVGTPFAAYVVTLKPLKPKLPYGIRRLGPPPHTKLKSGDDQPSISHIWGNIRRRRKASLACATSTASPKTRRRPATLRERCAGTSATGEILPDGSRPRVWFAFDENRPGPLALPMAF